MSSYIQIENTNLIRTKPAIKYTRAYWDINIKHQKEKAIKKKYRRVSTGSIKTIWIAVNKEE